MASSTSLPSPVNEPSPAVVIRQSSVGDTLEPLPSNRRPYVQLVYTRYTHIHYLVGICPPLMSNLLKV